MTPTSPTPSPRPVALPKDFDGPGVRVGANITSHEDCDVNGQMDWIPNGYIFRYQIRTSTS